MSYDDKLDMIFNTANMNFRAATVSKISGRESVNDSVASINYAVEVDPLKQPKKKNTSKTTDGYFDVESD